MVLAEPRSVSGRRWLLDHAGRVETSLLLALRPDLVRRDLLPVELPPKQFAVLGEHPSSASAEEGQELMARGIEAWSRWIAEPGDLGEYYGKRRTRYAQYRRAYYKGSWEDAIEKWWNEK